LKILQKPADAPLASSKMSQLSPNNAYKEFPPTLPDAGREFQSA
jgi:hypothetical protein